jgi:glycerol-3-phosphate dehydrogenase
LQNSDNRVVFVIPYENDYTLIGTTEEDVEGDPGAAAIASWEIDYLVEITNEYFKAQITKEDVVHVFAGVRPLLSDENESASEASRDYTLVLDSAGLPLLSVYGGKITTYRRLAESALEKLRDVFPRMGAAWSETAALPGGDFSTQTSLKQILKRDYSWLPDALLTRWVGSYGTLTYTILEGVTSFADLGEEIGAGLHCAHEWARTSEDILWRRSKLGLQFTDAQCSALEEYLKKLQ